MKHYIFTAATILVCTAAAVPTTAQAAADVLGNTRITYMASGSPNTITGSWVTNGIDIPSFSDVQYYKVEVLSFDSPFGQAVGLGFTNNFPGNATGLLLRNSCPLGISCIGTPEVGSVSIVDVQLTQQPQARDFLTRLDIDNPFYRASGPAFVNFLSGGSQTTASGELLITAYGQMPAVPEATSFSLIAIGILSLLALTARKKSTLNGSFKAPD